MLVEQNEGKHWPHAPLHKLDGNGIYIVTAATLHKRHLFKSPERLSHLETSLLKLAKQYGWQLEAWAVFSNHYHFVGRSEKNSETLRRFLTHLHADTARRINLIDRHSGRAVWFNFWDSKLTFEKSYLARLSYVHQNPVKHGLVKHAREYQWCSASWFERTVDASAVKMIYGFKTDRVNIQDDF